MFHFKLWCYEAACTKQRIRYLLNFLNSPESWTEGGGGGGGGEGCGGGGGAPPAMFDNKQILNNISLRPGLHDSVNEPQQQFLKNSQKIFVWKITIDNKIDTKYSEWSE